MKKIALTLFLVSSVSFAAVIDRMHVQQDMRVDGTSDMRGAVTFGGGITVNESVSLPVDSVDSSALENSSVTKQGNTFNGANQLARLDSFQGLNLLSTTTGTLTTTAPSAIGTLVFVTGQGLCVATGTAAGAWVRVLSTGTACQGN